MKTTTQIFQIKTTDDQHIIKATAYLNGRDQQRFRVSVNDSPICIFGWNDALGRFAIMKDARDPDIHPVAEMLIARKLETLFEMEEAA